MAGIRWTCGVGGGAEGGAIGWRAGTVEAVETLGGEGSVSRVGMDTPACTEGDPVADGRGGGEPGSIKDAGEGAERTLEDSDMMAGDSADGADGADGAEGRAVDAC